MAPLRNVLFVMCDQLRFDHLGCSGHATIKTPNLDRFSKQCTRFTNAFVQAGVCGPSRMSTYTGRYVSSHGVTWNRVPLPVGQLTLGDYLLKESRSLDLIGKSHVIPDLAGIERMGVNSQTSLWKHLASGGFNEIDRIDGHGKPGLESGYANWLRRKGYQSEDPWNDYVVSAQSPTGEKVSGWFLRNVHLPSLVAAEHSETAYVTDKAIDYLKEKAGQNWTLHLSYVKPHWPYMAPAPYHNKYSAKDIQPVSRNPQELIDPHPVYSAYLKQEESLTFAKEETVHQVRPVYMGLIEQVDSEFGRVLKQLEDSGEISHTLIIFTSDHGDLGGDHFLGEKDLFYDQVVKVPLMIFDPRPQANAMRGFTVDELVEAIDIVPTILEALGISSADKPLQGYSLLPYLFKSEKSKKRDFVISQIDYSFRKARLTLKRQPNECSGWMLRSQHWKYIEWQGFRPQLFNLKEDPEEFFDLGKDPGHAHMSSSLKNELMTWMKDVNARVTLSDQDVANRTDKAKDHGIYYGTW